MIIYNDVLSDDEKRLLKDYLENWELEGENLSKDLLKAKDIIDAWSDSIKDYCLIKINTQDELLEDLTEEE